jgi:hypothetical protein
LDVLIRQVAFWSHLVREVIEANYSHWSGICFARISGPCWHEPKLSLVENAVAFNDRAITQADQAEEFRDYLHFCI